MKNSLLDFLLIATRALESNQAHRKLRVKPFFPRPTPLGVRASPPTKFPLRHLEGRSRLSPHSTLLLQYKRVKLCSWTWPFRKLIKDHNERINDNRITYVLFKFHVICTERNYIIYLQEKVPSLKDMMGRKKRGRRFSIILHNIL